MTQARGLRPSTLERYETHVRCAIGPTLGGLPLQKLMPTHLNRLYSDLQKAGRAPSSEVAHWSMLGYRSDEFPGRAVFEALGRGQDVSEEHVFAYAALRPLGGTTAGRQSLPEPSAQIRESVVSRCSPHEDD